MLPSSFRFRGGKEIGVLRKDGLSYEGDFFVARYLIERESGSLFGVVVSSKISKKATRRNKCKRRIYEIIRLFLKNNEKMKGGLHCIFFVRSSILNANFLQLKESVDNFLTMINKDL